jgi:hypothetical protein
MYITFLCVFNSDGDVYPLNYQGATAGLPAISILSPISSYRKGANCSIADLGTFWKEDKSCSIT